MPNYTLATQVKCIFFIFGWPSACCGVAGEVLLILYLGNFDELNQDVRLLLHVACFMVIVISVVLQDLNQLLASFPAAVAFEPLQAVEQGPGLIWKGSSEVSDAPVRQLL